MYYKRIATVFFAFIFLIVLGPSYIYSAGNDDANVGGNSSGLVQCYRDRLFDQDIKCSLCGTSKAQTADDCRIGDIFDSTTCTCVQSGNNCQGKDVSDLASSCLSKNSNNFYNYNYCVCLDRNGKSISLVSPGNQNINMISGIKEDLFFKTNFDGTIQDIPEFVRMIFIIIFMIISIVAMFIGIYGMYVYSMAGEDDEKVQLAQKIFKNALIGLIIAIFGALIVQFVAGILGISDGLFDFTFNVS